MELDTGVLPYALKLQVRSFFSLGLEADQAKDGYAPEAVCSEPTHFEPARGTVCGALFCWG